MIITEHISTFPTSMAYESLQAYFELLSDAGFMDTF